MLNPRFITPSLLVAVSALMGALFAYIGHLLNETSNLSSREDQPQKIESIISRERSYSRSAYAEACAFLEICFSSEKRIQDLVDQLGRLRKGDLALWDAALHSVAVRGIEEGEPWDFYKEILRRAERAALGEAFMGKLTERYFLHWATKDSSMAIAFGRQIEDRALRQKALLQISKAIELEEPELSFVMYAEASGTLDETTARNVWRMLLEESPTQPIIAYELHKIETSSGWLQEVLGRAARWHLKKDPDFAVDWARRMGSPDLRSLAMEAVFGTMAKQDPKEAVERLSGLEDWQRNSGAVRAIAIELSKADPMEGVKWVNGAQAGIERFLIMRQLAREGAQVDPRYAAHVATWAAKTSDIAYVNFAAVAGRLAEVSHTEALEWFNSLEPDVHCDARATGAAIAVRWAGENPEEAWEQINKVRAGQARAGFARGVAEVLGSQDPDTGWEWLGELSEDVRREAMRGLVEGEVEHDPDSVVQRLAAQGADTRVASIPALIDKWASYNPAEAAVWLAQQPELPDLGQTVGQLVEKWSYVDPMAASRWVATLDGGEVRDEAALRIAELVSHHDPEAALQWAASIESAPKRGVIISKLLQRWMRMDPNVNRVLDALGAIEMPADELDTLMLDLE